MVVTDTWFSDSEKTLLAGLVGKRFEKYRVDESVSGAAESSFGVVGLFIDGRVFALTAEQEVHDFFGAQEDIAAVSFAETDEGGIGPHLVGVKQVDRPVDRTIEDVLLYEDRQIMREGGEEVFEYRYIGAIVFKLPHTEVVFEPDGWIMESFGVLRGPGASRSIRPADADIDDGECGRIRTERQVLSMREWDERRG